MFASKHLSSLCQATFSVGREHRVHTERATRNLALADALYPGWLARLLDSFSEARQYGGSRGAFPEN